MHQSRHRWSQKSDQNAFQAFHKCFFLCFSLTLTFLSRECSFLFCQECLGSTGPVVTSFRLAMWAGQAAGRSSTSVFPIYSLWYVYIVIGVVAFLVKKASLFIFLSCYGLWRSPICQDYIGISILLFLKLHFLQIFWKLIFFLMHVWRNYLMTWFRSQRLWLF